MKRQRKCDNPPPSLYGHYCIGDSSDYALCNGTDCDRHITPGPSTYAPEMCVDTLGDCDSVNQTLGVCKDRAHARTVCRKFCGLCTLVDGGWTEWTEWSGCSTTCDSGIKRRIRACTNPAPANGGNDCVGIATETSQCILRTCPVIQGSGKVNKSNGVKCIRFYVYYAQFMETGQYGVNGVLAAQLVELGLHIEGGPVITQDHHSMEISVSEIQ
ncbi:hypothetical protein CHS0354_003785 [Potamilus streckersoni]|uniref:Uncharacterized protein n=1 Tax=Potamilus streckersoni TaxID=2493646 RepID=A0AAE0W576_9BIVA|nr:hypothetical protein CHS0354_003785 [Potamilus streckersoni]